MKLIYTILVLLSTSIYGFTIEPDKKPGTDAMLFGDVKSGGEHIPFATITIKGTTLGVAADATGHFKMANLPTGKQTILISAVGYKTYEKKVDLESGKSITILAELETDNIGLEQVVVSADRNSKSRKETPTIVNSINAKILERTQNVTLSEGLNFSPGLRTENNCQNCGFTQIRMNGLEGAYSQILINSRPVFSGLAGIYGLEMIPLNMIERIEVVRGGGSAMYGSNAIAGIINLITKDPIVNNFSVFSSYGLTGFNTKNINEASPDFNLNFNGSFVTDDYKSGISIFGFQRSKDYFDANGDGYSELSLIKNTTLGTRYFQRISERGKLSVDYFNINEFRRGGNKFELPLHESDIAESVTHKLNSGAVSFDLLLREEDKLSAFFSFQSVDRQSYYGSNQDLSAYGQTNDITYSTGIQYIYTINYLLFSPVILTSGIEFNGSRLDDHKLGFYNPETNIHYGNTLVADQSINTKATFIQSEWKTKLLVLTVGLRFDHYTVTDNTNETDNINGNVMSPRISFLYNIQNNLQLRTGYARGFRAPQIFDEDLHIETSGARKVLHNNSDDLKQESSNSYTLSFDYTNNSGNWEFQILSEGFYTKLINPFANEYSIPDEKGIVYYTRFNAQKGATVKGLNIELNASPSGNIQFQSGITFQKSVYEEPQEFGEKRFFRSPDRYGYLSMNYNPSLLMSISFTGNYTGPMLVPYFGPKLIHPENGQLNKSTSFFDAGIKVSHDFKVSNEMKLQVNVGIKNILNSYQKDFDTGINRDPSYIYGPSSPRLLYLGIKFGSFY